MATLLLRNIFVNGSLYPLLSFFERRKNLGLFCTESDSEALTWDARALLRSVRVIFNAIKITGILRQGLCHERTCNVAALKLHICVFPLFQLFKFLKW